MKEELLARIRDLIQEDVGQRGLRTDPVDNLITACPDDFSQACGSIAETDRPGVAVVTGFYIPHATPPCGETDGPLGALFLARALVPLGIRTAIITDSFARGALEAGLKSSGLEKAVTLLTIPGLTHPWEVYLKLDWRHFLEWFPITHLVALERVGPSHTVDSLRAQKQSTQNITNRFEEEIPIDHRNRCHTMRGLDITEHMSPAELLFETGKQVFPSLTTIGIGDGGNEIGMGKIPWDTIRRNIPRGGLVACRVPTDYLIVCGVSNWGAYGLAAGVRLLRGAPPDPELFDPARERELLRIMVERGPLVDGTSGQATVTVDGLSFERYVEPLVQIGKMQTA